MKNSPTPNMKQILLILALVGCGKKKAFERSRIKL